MNYFELLNLRREPFSNSPDPELFYDTVQHRECLRSLEISIRLRRGLSAVTGHVGTGKTTLCRQLIRVLESRQGACARLILDPFFSEPAEFLRYLCRLFEVDDQRLQGATDWQMRELVKDALFTLAVEQGRLAVLIVDEAQKMSPQCLEILREMLNFETNEHKLLQIVLFGQLELSQVLAAQANLADRVSLHYRLGPLDFRDTRELILARLTMCAKDRAPEGLFTFGAFLAVYLATDGFPRQIVQLCHQALLAVIIKEKPRVTWGVVRGCMRWRSLGLPRRRRAALPLTILGVAVLVGVGFALPSFFGAGSVRLGFEELRRPFVSAASPAGGSKNSPAGRAGEVSDPRGHAQSGTLLGAQSGASPAASPDAAGLAVSKPPSASAPAVRPDNAPPPERLFAASANPEREDDRPVAPGAPRFLGVSLGQVDGRTVLEILTDRPAGKTESGARRYPARLVVDLFGQWDRQGRRELAVSDARVEKVRVATLADRLRVVVYLKNASARPAEPRLERTDQGLRLTVGE